tara:strand:- start:580 stop:1140 length:561 start_codon:yes stop_codon:yes gene_type:complete
MKGSSRSAFSLIELLVVVGILGIIVGIFFTGFSYIFSKQKDKQAKMEIAALKTAVHSYSLNHGSYPNCSGGVCTPGECLFLSLAGFHNAEGTLEVPPYPTTIPAGLFGYELMSFDVAEIPDLSHSGGNSVILWLSETLGKDPEFLDPWGNEYVYEFPREDGNSGFRLFSKGPDGKTTEGYTEDDIR